MPDLFGNVTSQLPPWLTNQPSGAQFVDKAFQAKQQALKNFSDLTELSMRMQQQEALLPLQIQAQRNQIASQTLDIAGKQIAQDNELSTKAGLVTLGGKLSSIKDWSSPDAPAAIWETIRDNPKLALTPAGQKALAQAEAMHSVASNMDTRIAQSTIASEARAAAAETRASALLENTNLLTTSKEKIASENAQLKRDLLDTKIDADYDKTVMQLEKAGFKFKDHAMLAALKGDISAINQDPTTASDPNKKQLAIQRAVAKYTSNTPSTPAPVAAFKSQDDVVQAFKAGKLSYKDAAKILKDQFGAQ